MSEFFLKLFDTADFPPRWHCGHWTPGHGWLHVLSDTAIAGAYAAIPLLILFFAWQRRDLPFLPVFALFAMFIFACGFGHLIEATIFWHPWYRFSGLIKVITAIVSWVTVFALVPLIPRALALPKLASANEALAAEVGQRRETERKLNALNQDLQRFIANVVNREDRILELKKEVNELLAQSGSQPRYTED